jgi:hypothetical protein
VAWLSFTYFEEPILKLKTHFATRTPESGPSTPSDPGRTG